MVTQTCINGDTIKNIGKFKLVNYQCGDDVPNLNPPSCNTTSCVTLYDDNSFGTSWNCPSDSQGTYSYPCITTGDSWGSNTWSPPFEILYSNLNTFSVDLTWYFKQVPQNTQWDLAWDIYWVDSSYTSYYNIMIWLQGQNPTANLKGTVSDGYNSYKYYKKENPRPKPMWDAFVLQSSSIPQLPELNKTYSIHVDIKALMNQISDTLASSLGGWYIPSLQLGCEMGGGSGANSGTWVSTNYSVEVNGQVATQKATGACPGPMIAKIGI